MERPAPYQPGVRRSCERCRKKKTKCPAEKPVCSFCRRLNQPCVYLPRNHCTPKDYRPLRKGQKSTPPSDEAVYDPFSENASKPRNHDVIFGASLDHNPNALPNPRLHATNSLSTWSPANPEPSQVILNSFVEIYRTKIYFQPLPLFEIDDLRDQLAEFPHYLRWSFLALVLNFTTHPFYYGLEARAMEYYSTSARSIALDLAAEGIAKIEVLQALCLLSLTDIMADKPSRAWMTIGSAARLEVSRLLAIREEPNASNDDSSLRCHWSIITLEKAFSPGFATYAGTAHTLSYPGSVPRPPPPHHQDKSSYPGLSNAYERDHVGAGINACTLFSMTLWGDVTSYLLDIRSGKFDQPWVATSRYNELTARVYEYDAMTEYGHLLRNIAFPDRTRSDLESLREYWTPWVLMQFYSHAAQAALNNPFVQLVALRGASDVSQPRSYLQKTVDQAIFNSDWVFRILTMCEELAFEINDPVIGQMVAQAVSIPWLFQFARDRKVSNKAKANIALAETFLAHLSKKWPHIGVKLDILQSLQSKVNEKLQENDPRNSTIRFNPEMIWRLLDPNITQQLHHIRSTFASPGDNVGTPMTSIQVTTKFIHPVADEQEDVATGSLDPVNESHNTGDIHTELFLDMFCSEPQIGDLTWASYE